MTAPTYDVVAIGNAIVEIIGRCDDAFLATHNCPKGHMRLVDDATISALYNNMGPSTEISGGSAANTAVGIASFGGKAAFIGRIAADEFGRIFAHDIKAAGFLYGYTQGRDLAACGRLASIAAAEIISHTGARPATSLAALARSRGV